MKNTSQNPLEFNGILDLADRIPDDSAALEYFKQIRWNGNVYCPYCQSNDIFTRKNGKSYDCKGCKTHFTDKSGTIFADTKIGMRKWIMAMYFLTANKKGISSHDLGRKIKVTQKTAWLMLNRIQTAFMSGGFNVKSSGSAQCDESYVGGLEFNKHKDKRTPGAEGRSTKVKTAVLAIVTEDQGVYAVTIPDATGESILPIIKANVEEGATIMTDEFAAYRPLSKAYEHFFVRHGAGEFAAGTFNEITVNRCENYFSHFKRMFHGVHHHLSRKHMNKYLAAESYRMNQRTMEEWERLAFAVGKAAHTYVTCKQIVKEA